MKDKYTETFETWDKVAKLYQDLFMDLNLYDDTYDLFCKRVSKINANIFEIGCGPGNITKYLLSKRPDFIVEAIDISPNMIELAKANNPSANCLVMDSRNIDYITAKFDAVIIGFCIPYLSESDVSKLVEDCSNLLEVGGILYLSFVEGDSSDSGFQTGSSGDRAYFYYHNLEVLKTVLQENNFMIHDLIYKPYMKRDGSEEVHTILIAELVSNTP